MNGHDKRWYGDDSGPMLRLYALTRGRARTTGEEFDVIALVLARTQPENDLTLSPEQALILELCRDAMLSVAEIAARSGLPVSVLRVLLADLHEAGHVQITQPDVPGRLPNDHILREVLHGLRAL